MCLLDNNRFSSGVPAAQAEQVAVIIRVHGCIYSQTQNPALIENAFPIKRFPGKLRVPAPAGCVLGVYLSVCVFVRAVRVYCVVRHTQCRSAKSPPAPAASAAPHRNIADAIERIVFTCGRRSFRCDGDGSGGTTPECVIDECVWQGSERIANDNGGTADIE